MIRSICYGLFVILFVLSPAAHANQAPTVQAITKTVNEDKSTVANSLAGAPAESRINEAAYLGKSSHPFLYKLTF